MALRREGGRPDLIRKKHQECLCPCHCLRLSLQCPFLQVRLTLCPFPWHPLGAPGGPGVLGGLHANSRAYPADPLRRLRLVNLVDLVDLAVRLRVCGKVVGDGARRFGA